MEQYKIQMINKYTREVEEDNVDDMIFDSEEDAKEYALYLSSCCEQGREDLELRDPFGYEDYHVEDDVDFIVVEIE